MKENFRQSAFVDKSAQLSVNWSSLTLINMIKLKSRVDSLDSFIDKKLEEKSTIFKPFS